jgi:hypothetical protein
MKSDRIALPVLLPLLLAVAGCEDFTITLKPDGIESAADAAADGDLDLEVEIDTAAVDDYLEAGCGASEATALRVRRLQLLIDAVDSRGRPWDRDATVEDFVEVQDRLRGQLEALASDDSPYDPDALLEDIADEHATILANPDASPDPVLTLTGVSGAAVDADVRSLRGVQADHNLISLVSVELDLEAADSALLIEIEDDDGADGQHVGWVLLDRSTLRSLAGCGPRVEVYTEADQQRLGSRIVAMGIEVEER